MLTKFGREAATVFDLLGHDEVNLTAALGWVLSRSPVFLGALAEHLGCPLETLDASVALEVVGVDGRTDIELTTGTTKIIIEAKQGWLVPGEAQLSKYADRFNGFDSTLLVSLSDSSNAWADDQLPVCLGEVPIQHIPWDELRRIIRDCKHSVHGKQRWWLEELEDYMGHATSVRRFDDQYVFCVVVSNQQLGARTFREYVSQDRVYFHPYGGNNGWPKLPPNFLCFRWDGKVQQVNRVVRTEIVPRLSDRWPEISDTADGEPHIVYTLGDDIPVPTVSTAGTYASGRVWCLLDQLLVQPTLADAVRSSKKLSVS
ncbi:hypothetical protein [Rhodococcoides yunnanense]|uniref:hypothetical protein n=1 Tax=Rhodococcoides yunnanense TaxID=278209 RepID=UPI00111490E2|nr:hypothetical protein [Rhodococcus yunnanensis]